MGPPGPPDPPGDPQPFSVPGLIGWNNDHPRGKKRRLRCLAPFDPCRHFIECTLSYVTYRFLR